jgi:hypothetical protein
MSDGDKERYGGLRGRAQTWCTKTGITRLDDAGNGKTISVSETGIGEKFVNQSEG